MAILVDKKGLPVKRYVLSSLEKAVSAAAYVSSLDDVVGLVLERWEAAAGLGRPEPAVSRRPSRVVVTARAGVARVADVLQKTPHRVEPVTTVSIHTAKKIENIYITHPAIAQSFVYGKSLRTTLIGTGIGKVSPAPFE